MAKKELDLRGDESSKQNYKEKNWEAKKQVAMAKEEALSELYERLETKGEKYLYRMA